MCGGIEHTDLNFYSIICCICLSVVSGPVGCFLNWNRLSGYTDGLSHSAILGVSLSLLLGVKTFLGIFISSILFAFFISVYSSAKGQIKESVNFIICRTFVALGIIIGMKFNMDESAIESVLFGSINHNDASLILLATTISIISGIYIAIRRKKLLLMSINSEIALSEGVNIFMLRLESIIFFSAFISMVTVLFGTLMSVAIVVGPSSIARCFSRNVTQMTIYSSCISLFIFLFSALVAKILKYDIAAVFCCILFLCFSLSVFKTNFFKKI